MNIAVIGTGIGGMSAAWLLDQGHEITVYEKNERIGGHSNTVDAPGARGNTPVDTGFIVYNERNYPNLTALFSHLNVPVKNSDMSFAASLDHGAFEYSGTDLDGLLGQRRNIVRPRFWRMLADLRRFYREAPSFLSEPNADGLSLAAWLERERFGDSFVLDHLLPMGAAIWSTTTQEMRDYPAASFIRFFLSHGLLTMADRPQWRTVDGGSREYVRRLTAPWRHRVRYGGVRAIRRSANGVEVQESDGTVRHFDHVVVATHADEAFALLADPDPMESNLLGSWRYTQNRALLHRDAGLMPRHRRVWSSWNFIDNGDDRLCVTYWMNRLQSLDDSDPLFVTLNPRREPAPESVIYETTYAHPYFDAAALASQRHLWSLQGRRRTWFCGSYFGHGFHEDALQSGLAVAEALGGLRRPWMVEGESDRIWLGTEPTAVAA